MHVNNDIPVEREWIGTLDGMDNAALKAQAGSKCRRLGRCRAEPAARYGHSSPWGRYSWVFSRKSNRNFACFVVNEDEWNESDVTVFRA